mmetsp:Transcript_97134/g.258121  ORF Transcript_97134/g.258121 Transcript_97134/m.258121 type:complete len:94 (-) Transcript_97134:260-541(-)
MGSGRDNTDDSAIEDPTEAPFDRRYSIGDGAGEEGVAKRSSTKEIVRVRRQESKNRMEGFDEKEVPKLEDVASKVAERRARFQSLSKESTTDE